MTLLLLTLDWQNVAAILLVLLASAYLARALRATFAASASGKSCGGCAKCPGGSAPESGPAIVSVESLIVRRG